MDYSASAVEMVNWDPATQHKMASVIAECVIEEYRIQETYPTARTQTPCYTSIIELVLEKLREMKLSHAFVWYDSTPADDTVMCSDMTNGHFVFDNDIASALARLQSGGQISSMAVAEAAVIADKCAKIILGKLTPQRRFGTCEVKIRTIDGYRIGPDMILPGIRALLGDTVVVGWTPNNYATMSFIITYYLA